MTTCKNCSNEFEGKFCPQCGQKASVKRFSTRIVFSQLMDKLLPLDRGILFTSREVILHPGTMLRGYLAGKRANYSKPFQFLLVLVAISLVFFSKGDFESGMKYGMNNNSAKAPSEAALEFQRQIAEFVTSHISLIMMGMVPFLAWVGRWFYRKHDVNYAEHFVVNCYLMAGNTLLSIPFLAVLNLSQKSAMTPIIVGAFLTVYVGYFAWVHILFFQEKNRWWNGIKGILTYLVAYVLYIFFIGFVALIGATVYFKLLK